MRINLNKLARLVPDVDLHDAFFFVGLAMLWYGLYLVSDALAWAVCGGIFISIGLRR